ncbi:MAG: LysR family transcriptional regulator [Lachnospiraceae bacterium]|nr:LysR family transcriptional regulator [Lachnospiraceae bacterium]
MEQNFSYYYIFNAVARTGNISRASKELFISQPAISKAIKKLESNLGTRLFIRGSRGVILSEEGRLLYEHTKNAFLEIEEGEASLKRRSTFEIGQISLGTSTSLCRFVLLPYLKEFVKKHPHIKVTIHCNPTLETIPLIERGQVDIGLIVNTKNLRHMKFYSLGEIKDSFVATKIYLDHLKEREGGDKIDYFQTGNIMLMDKQNMTRQHIDHYLSAQGLIPRQILEVNSMDLLIDFAKIGMGIAGVTKNFVKEELKTGKLIELPLEQPIPGREIGFTYDTRASLSRSVAAFIEFIEEVLGKYPI